jgi:hypothetical protein
LLVEGTNVLNHTNFSAVNDVFPAHPEPFQIGSQTLDLLNGPYNLRGEKGLVRRSRWRSNPSIRRNICSLA